MNIAFAVVKNIGCGGGIEKYTAELGAHLARRGHGVRVYSMRHYGPVAPVCQGMRIIGVPCVRRVAMEKLSASTVAMLHAGLSPWADIVHAHTVGPGIMGWFTRLCGKVTVVQFHGVEWRRSRWSTFGARVLRSLERGTVRCNRQFTAVSRAQCEYYTKTYGLAVKYIPGGAEIKPAPAPREILALGLEPRRYILFASRLVREKGAHYLIAAFRRLGVDDKLVLAGDAPGCEAYKQELRRLAGDDPRVIWTGFVGGRLLEELFCHARVFVQPSDVEGLSVALLEAMSYGTLCLVSDIPENIEAVDCHGLHFRRGDTDDLAAKLGALCAGQCRDAPQAAVHVAQRYSWDTIAAEFERYYAGLLADVAARRGAPAPLTPKG